MAPTPKPAGKAQHRTSRRSDRVLSIVPTELVETPQAPTELGVTGQQAWADFWGSPLAQLVRFDTDLEALRRLFELREERGRLWRRACKEPVVVGSTKQERSNQLFDVVARMDGEIRALEDRFGLTPKARLQLGVTFAQGQAAAERAARTSREINADEDPRQAEVEDDQAQTPAEPGS